MEYQSFSALQGTSLGFATLFFALVAWYFYTQSFHPLSQYPGPALASFTNLWKSYQVWHGTYELTLLDLHRKYGPIVRIGPNHLDISHASVIKEVFGAGKSFKKSSFYDAFTALRPNLFGARDEEVHAARRKATSNSFSAQSVLGMETYMDSCMELLINHLDEAARRNEVVDLKAWIAYFVLDVLGELAFSKSFGIMASGGTAEMPPIEKHVLLATVSGQTPWIIPYVNKYLPYVPVRSLQESIQGRLKLRQLAIDSVNQRIAINSQRKDLLGRLLEEFRAGTDNKGRQFDLVDVQTEAFGFIIAGSHTTATSTTLLLWHLLHTPDTLSRLVEELDSVKAPEGGGVSFPFSSTSSLPYLQSCISEGFRINPVFVMPLIRVVPEGGKLIAGAFCPAGTEVSVCNFALHHDEAIFGPDLECFVPQRWMSERYDKAGMLMPFGAGHRACIGRNIALTEIHKLLVSLLKRYDVSLVDAGAAATGGGGGAGESRMPVTTSFGVSDLHGKLEVRLKFR